MGQFATKSMRKMSRKMSLFSSRESNIEKAITDEMDAQKERFIPESLELLVKETSFTKRELKYLYQCFKQNCPSGYVTRDQFVIIFRQFFSMQRLSDPGTYAHLVFDTFDDDNNGRISFSEFVQELSMFSKGSIEERLDWIFDLYDTRRREYVTEEDYFKVALAMYAIIGIHYWKEKQVPVTLKRHLKHQFQLLDTNRDGKITRAEFIEGCQKDKQILESLEALRIYL